MKTGHTSQKIFEKKFQALSKANQIQIMETIGRKKKDKMYLKK